MKLKYERPLADNEDLYIMNDESFLFTIRRLTSFQCSKTFSETLKNHPKNLAREKYKACLLYHLSSSVRQCVSEEYFQNDDYSEKTYQNFIKCLESDKDSIEITNEFTSRLKFKYSPYLEYKRQLQGALKMGNLPNLRAIKEHGKCFNELKRFNRCIQLNSKRLNIETHELLNAIEEKKSDFCFHELTKFNYCVAVNCCAKQIGDCMERRKTLPNMDESLLFEECLASNEVNTCCDKCFEVN